MFCCWLYKQSCIYVVLFFTLSITIWNSRLISGLLEISTALQWWPSWFHATVECQRIINKRDLWLYRKSFALCKNTYMFRMNELSLLQYVTYYVWTILSKLFLWHMLFLRSKNFIYFRSSNDVLALLGISTSTKLQCASRRGIGASLDWARPYSQTMRP